MPIAGSMHAAAALAIRSFGLRRGRANVEPRPGGGSSGQVERKPDRQTAGLGTKKWAIRKLRHATHPTLGAHCAATREAQLAPVRPKGGLTDVRFSLA